MNCQFDHTGAGGGGAGFSSLGGSAGAGGADGAGFGPGRRYRGKRRTFEGAWFLGG